MSGTSGHRATPKEALRTEALARRNKTSAEWRRSASGAIALRLAGLGAYRAAQAVMFYLSFRSEVETGDMVQSALALGKKVIVPKVNRALKALDLYEIQGRRDLNPGYMGIPEPDPAKARLGQETPELVIVPGAAFDPSGGRIGYGGGYYDRFLGASGATTVALAFECQLYEALPQDAHDRRVDMIVTEERTIDCRKQA